MTASTARVLKRVLEVVAALLILWALLYLATILNLPFVREAGGRAT